ncbi:MAG: 6-aminohexanoate-dimer hydrolase [Flavobacteriaceae bacterium]|nr:MAG: 6-aminohexanoate-dimer hydrolase [Flavobacteriaceae bacterium]
MKNFFLRSGIVLCVLFSLLYISKYSYLLKGIQTIYLSGHTTAFLEDYNRFSNDTVNTSNTTQPWPFHKSYNKYPTPEDLEDYHKNQRTVAYLIIKNDSILYEKYYDGFDKDAKSNSFSVVKSMVTAMLGIALKEGTIKSLDQKVIEFIPELKGPYASSVTVGDLSSMASGQKWGEAYYNPFSVTSAAYFVNSLDTLILNQPIHHKPGQTFNYQSGTTQLLGMVIKRATGKKLSDYLSEKLWKPMGAEHPALWQLDSDESGMEKAFCCLASNARDFARFGKLFKNNGQWDGQQLLDSSFVALALKPRFQESPEYGYGWWLDNYKDRKVYMMRGHLGQYVLVVPDEDLIVVRLGHLKDKKSTLRGKSTGGDPFTNDIYVYLDTGLEMIKNVTKN